MIYKFKKLVDELILINNSLELKKRLKDLKIKFEKINNIYDKKCALSFIIDKPKEKDFFNFKNFILDYRDILVEISKECSHMRFDYKDIGFYVKHKDGNLFKVHNIANANKVENGLLYDEFNNKYKAGDCISIKTIYI